LALFPFVGWGLADELHKIRKVLVSDDGLKEYPPSQVGSFKSVLINLPRDLPVKFLFTSMRYFS